MEAELAKNLLSYGPLGVVALAAVILLALVIKRGIRMQVEIPPPPTEPSRRRR